ncbi:MAG: ATP-binding protein [Bacteroidales bacterium]|nr:ATP-binding protein [Bacteroidales bacterium]
MDLLFERHSEYLSGVPTAFERELMFKIDWESRLVLIRGPKGVGKSTLMQQYILKHYGISDRHVLYCSADSSYFASHTLLDTAAAFVRQGGKHLFIDEIHKYEGWSREIKEIYDLYRDLKVVLSGSSLLQLNDGQADLSRRQDIYDMSGLSFREYLWFRTGKKIEPVRLDQLLENASGYCLGIRSLYRPLEFFEDYLRFGYYPYSFEKKNTYKTLVESVANYIIEVELTKFRGVNMVNTRKIKALLNVISEMLPYQVDLSKLSSSVSIDRVTLVRYLRFMDEAKLIRNLFTEIDMITDLQKPDKILLDNTNLSYAFAIKEPERGTLRETFFCNQLSSAGHIVEYGGLQTGDYRIDKSIVIEVGGAGKDFSQINSKDIANAALALDDIDMASGKKIPLWAFGFLY